MITNLSYGKTLKVMVLDTGVDSSNPFLVKYIPNKYLNDDNKTDEHGHGSHIVGILTLKACRDVQLIPCKAFEYKNNEALGKVKDRTIDCLNLALEYQVDIINYSGGGNKKGSFEFNLFNKLDKLGVKIITAAGNNGKNIDINENYYYPASYKLKNRTVVGNIDKNHIIHSTSNYGKNVIYEIGVNVRSFDNKGNLVYMSGTSQSTAIYTSKLIEEFCKNNLNY